MNTTTLYLIQIPKKYHIKINEHAILHQHYPMKEQSIYIILADVQL